MSNTAIQNPYLAGKNGTHDRYLDLAAARQHWRNMAFVCGTIALGSLALNAYQATQQRFVPYIGLIDSVGRTVVGGVGARLSDEQLDRVKRSTMQDFISSLRSLTTDGVAQRASVDHVYAHIGQGSGAQGFVSDWYRTHHPFERAKKETVGVEVRSVLPTSDRTYEVDWTETTRDLYGAVTQTEQWKALLTVGVSAPKDEATARVNPLGLYVQQISWSRVL